MLAFVCTALKAGLPLSDDPDRPGWRSDRTCTPRPAADVALRAGVSLVQDFAGQHEKQAAALQAQLQHLETQVGLLTTQYDSQSVARRY